MKKLSLALLMVTLLLVSSACSANGWMNHHMQGDHHMNGKNHHHMQGEMMHGKHHMYDQNRSTDND